MIITTATGDMGKTDISGERVDKCCDIIELLGTLDEAASVIAVARSIIGDESASEELLSAVSAITVLASGVNKKEDADLTEETEFLEKRIEFYEAKIEKIVLFEYPSKKEAAVLDYARCVVRRAERCAVRCSRDVRYLNRLSDYLFVLSRYMEYGEKI